MESATHWQRVWRTITQHNEELEPFELKTIIDKITPDLLEGILFYKPFVEDDFSKAVEKIEFTDSRFQSFFLNICINLNLETEQAWGVFCNYLMFEYYGKLETVQMQLELSCLSNDFVINLYRFYCSERQFLLKTLGHLLENCHELDLTDEYLGPFPLSTLRINLLKQFDFLIREKPVKDIQNIIKQQDWVDRNLNEQQQVLLIYVSSACVADIRGEELLNLLDVFMSNRFSSASSVDNIKEYANIEVLRNIRHLETALFLIPIRSWWDSPDIWKEYRSRMHRIISVHDHYNENEQYIILLLAWSALNLRQPIADRHYNKYMLHCLERYAFGRLKNIINNDIFKHSKIGDQLKLAVFNFIYGVVDCFTERCFQLVYPQIVDIFCDFISNEDFYKFTISSDSVIKPAFDLAWNMFPFNFCPLTTLASTVIAIPRHKNWMFDKLCTLKKFTTEFENENEDISTGLMNITTDFRPFNNDLIVIRPDTEVEIKQLNGKYIMVIEKSYSYFTVFRCLVRDVGRSLCCLAPPSEIVEKSVIAGYNFLIKLLATPNFVMNDINIIDCLKLSAILLDDSNAREDIRISLKLCLFRVCLNVCKFQLIFPMHNLIHISAIQKFVPHFSETNRDYLEQGFLDENIIETFDDAHCLAILEYMNLVMYAIENDVCYVELQEPGVIYLLTYVLPLYRTQLLSPNILHTEICCNLTKITHFMIDKQCIKRVKQPTHLDSWILNNLVQNNCLLEKFCEILAIGNLQLTLDMGRVPYWLKSGARRAKLIFSTIQRTIVIAQCAMKYVGTNEGHSLLMPVLKVLYPWNPYQISNLKLIAGYTNHIIDRSLPVVACRCLQTFVATTRLPIYKSLEVDPYQMQSMFLDKLKDPFQSSNLKLAIIEFVSSCLDQQYTTSLGFFQQTDGTSAESTITSFILAWLQSEYNGSKDGNSKMEGAIVDMLHKLWLTRKVAITSILRENPTFWNYITDCLISIKDKVNIVKAGQVLEIVFLEMFDENEVIPQGVSEFIHTIFQDSAKTLIKWSVFFNNQKDDPYERLRFLINFKEFILIILKRHPNYYEAKTFSTNLVDLCWDNILTNITTPNSMQFCEQWAEIFLRFTHKFPQKLAESKNLTVRGTQFADGIYEVYDLLNLRNERILITLLSLISDAIKISNLDEPSLNFGFLKPLSIIFEDLFQKIMKLPTEKREQCVSLVTIVMILDKFVEYTYDADFKKFFVKLEYVNKLTLLTFSSLQNEQMILSSTFIAKCLYHCATSPLIDSFRSVPLDFYYSMFSPLPKYVLDYDQLIYGKIPDVLLYFWKFFTTWCHINIIFLQELDVYGFSVVVLFIREYKTLFTDIFASIQTVIHEANLNALCACMELLHELSDSQLEWYRADINTVRDLLPHMPTSLGMCIKIICWPTILSFVQSNKSPQELMQNPYALIYRGPEPDELLHQYAELLNLIYKTLTLHCRVIMKFSNLKFSEINNYFFPNGPQLLKYHFRMPRIGESEEILTFGGFLNVGNIIIKQLNELIQIKSTVKPDPIKEYYNVVVERPSTLKRAILARGISRFNVYNGTFQPEHIIRLNQDILMDTVETLYTLLGIYTQSALLDTSMSIYAAKNLRQEISYELANFYVFVYTYLVRLYSADKKPLQMGTHSLCTKIFSKRPFDKRIRCMRDKYLNALSYWYMHICNLVYYSHIDQLSQKDSNE